MKEDKRTSKVKIYGDEFFAENGKDIKEILKDLIKREAQNIRISKPSPVAICEILTSVF